METMEVLIWRKSSHSSSNGGNCVEVADAPHAIAVRDSKNADGVTLAFSRDSWQAFTHRTAMAMNSPLAGQG